MTYHFQLLLDKIQTYLNPKVSQVLVGKNLSSHAVLKLNAMLGV